MTTGGDKQHLVAVCGTYCGACPAYVAKHGDGTPPATRSRRASTSAPMSATIPDPSWMDGLLCDGCLSGGEIPEHCQKCAMKECTESRPDATRCSDCDELPCDRIMELIDTGLLHRAEYLPNLEKIRQMGVQAWADYEEERWRCPQCGLPMRWYDVECAGCGKLRSERVFPLV